MFNVGDKVTYTGTMQLIGKTPFKIFYLYPATNEALIVSADQYDFTVSQRDLVPEGWTYTLPKVFTTSQSHKFNGNLADPASLNGMPVFNYTPPEDQPSWIFRKLPASEPVCECGGDKHHWGHSDWCKKFVG